MLPTAIFTGEYSDSLAAQRWLHSVIPGSTLFVYSAAEQGDHFLAFKNPTKFTADLQTFLKHWIRIQDGHLIMSKDVISQEQAAVDGALESSSSELLASSASWNGKPYEIYPAGQPELHVNDVHRGFTGDLPAEIVCTYSAVAGQPLSIHEK